MFRPRIGKENQENLPYKSIFQTYHIVTRPKKKCGFPVSRPYLAFGRRNPDPKRFYWIMLVSVST
jgi:hypothetical protein